MNEPPARRGSGRKQIASRPRAKSARKKSDPADKVVAEIPAGDVVEQAADALPAFDDLGLIPELLQAVKDAGYTSPTPIQLQAIPHAMQGRDLIGLAQTGTGKTASFTLPILHRLLEEGQGHVTAGAHRVRVLVLTPTRELCVQVDESFRKYGKHTTLRVAAI